MAITDQGLVSGGSFLINLLLARWLDPAGYGAYALGTYSFMLFSALHDALLLEPMSVLGPARYSDRLPDYFRAQLRLHWGVAAIIALLLLGGAGTAFLSSRSSPLAGAFLGAALAAPCILLNWLVRRLTYLQGRIRAANLGALAFLVCCIIGLTVVQRGGWMTPLAGFAVLAGASVLGAGVQLLAVPFDRIGSNEIDLRLLIREQWEFGRWQLAAAVLRISGMQAQAYVVATYLGLAATGTVRAMELAIVPMTQAMTALGTLTIPILSKDFGRGDMMHLWRKTIVLTVGMILLSCLYEAGLILFHAPMEHLVYDGKYASAAWLIPILGLGPILTALTLGNSLILRAAQKPKHYLVSAAICAPLGLLSALVLTLVWGMTGAVVSIVATQAASMIVAQALRARWVPMNS